MGLIMVHKVSHFLEVLLKRMGTQKKVIVPLPKLYQFCCSTAASFFRALRLVFFGFSPQWAFTHANSCSSSVCKYELVDNQPEIFNVQLKIKKIRCLSSIHFFRGLHVQASNWITSYCCLHLSF